MARLATLAKGTAAFVVLAFGVSIIVGSLMGGGFSSGSRGYDKPKPNEDPRSILVHAVLIESDTPLPGSMLPVGSPVNAAGFDAMLDDARQIHASAGSRLHAPSVLVQHNETASITLKLADRLFDANISPSVIDTKHGPVLRIHLQLERHDTDSSAAPREFAFSTAYTSAPGGAIVLDLSGVTDAGVHARLALRSSLIDPTPAASN